MSCSNNRRETLAIFSLLSLLISITGSVLYFVMAYSSGTIYKSLLYLWVVFSILSIILPIVAKLIRKKNNQKGAKLETIAIFFAGLNFYFLIFLLTELPMILGFLGWVICSFVYATIEKAITKRILLVTFAILLAVVLAIGAIHIFSGNNESKNISVSISDVSALAGDTVKLPFSMDGNSAIWGGQVIINYDASVFEYVSCSNGEVFDFCEDNDNKGQLAIVVTQMDDKNTDKNGLVATLNFKVKTTADDGEYKISFDKETNFSNIEGELKEVSFDNGTVTVK